MREITGTQSFQLSEQKNVINFLKSQYQLHYQQFRVTIFKVSIAKEGTEAVRAEPEYDSFGWQQFCPEVGSRLREYSVCIVKLTGRP